MLWLSTRFGASVLRRWIKLDPDARKDFGTILATTLTLNGLIIGFTFSMAIGRYEQRKNYEEAEANAIGTEFVRADVLAAADGAKVRTLLLAYVDQRLAFYTAGSEEEITANPARTSQLQKQLWAAVLGTAAAQPTAIGAPGDRRHERRLEFAGIHAVCLVEPDPGRGMDFDGGNCSHLSHADRLWRAEHQIGAAS